MRMNVCCIYTTGLVPSGLDPSLFFCITNDDRSPTRRRTGVTQIPVHRPSGILWSGHSVRSRRAR